MYIKKLVYENVGPLGKIDIDMPFTENALPKPILFVGENGSGKSTILSNIVDSFYEVAGKAFNDARKSDGRTGYQYYKAISPIEISTGKEYMFSYILFQDSADFSYIYKSGKLSVKELKQKLALENATNLNWNESVNFKYTNVEEREAERIWDSNVVCYFGPDRYEKPFWLGDKYHQNNDFAHPSLQQYWSGRITNPISVKNVVSTNLQWLLDVIVDSRADISVEIDKLAISHVDIETLISMRRARENIELIMSSILNEDIYFGLNLRNRGWSRFKVQRKSDDYVVAPSLDSLSTGQLAIFNIFSTIVRYADMNSLYNSINLSDICGIVVIDEIELHLHTKLQKEVLPKLIKLFPKVQFIITTHAPLFLLGMQETFGEDNYEIYEMPNATKIEIERFSEFQRAYDYFRQTTTYKKDVEIAIAQTDVETKTLIITEGSTDWKHIKAAYNILKDKPQYAKIFTDLEFEFFEYEPANSKETAKHKLEMGNTALTQICESMSKLPQNKTYIFIADRDHEATNKKLSSIDKIYKSWGNNVYSFIIPVPESRKSTPSICIEHLYSDDEIKTEVTVNGINRRLYIGNEFDERGIAYSIEKVCEKKSVCGSKSIAIIEGTQGDKVTSLKNDSNENFALPKSKFANCVLNREEPFRNFNFDNFVEIFRVIKEIVSQGEQ